MKLVRKRLSDVAEVIAGQSPPSSTYNKVGDGLPFYQGKADFGVRSPITRTWCSEPNKIAEAGDILMSVRAPIGPVNICAERSAIGRGLAAIRAKEGYSNEYLFAFLKRQEKALAALGTGSTFTAISSMQLRAFKVPVVGDGDDQHRIARLLSRAEGLIAQRKESIRLIDELVRSVFLEMFGIANPKRGTWKVETLNRLASSAPNSVRSGPFGSDLLHSEFVDEGIAVLGIDNAVQNRFAWGQLRYITPEKYERLQRYTVSPGDVLITIMATNGRSAVVPEGIPTAINSKHLACISLDRAKADPYFISYSIHSDPFILGQLRSRHRGAIMTGLNLSLIKSLKFAMPELAEQKRFAALYLTVENIKATYDKSLTELEQLYGSLSQRAFRGELIQSEFSHALL